MSFWNNPENNSLKMLLIVAGIGIAGAFAFSFAQFNPFASTGRVIRVWNGYGYSYVEDGSDTAYGYAYAYTNPVVTTVAATSIGTTTANLNGNVISTGGGPVSRAFQYGTTTAYGLYNAVDLGKLKGSTGPFTGNITGLTCNTTYHYQAMAANWKPLDGKGVDMTFKTLPCVTATAPRVSTNPPTTLTQTSVILIGYVSATGGPGVYRDFNYGLTTAYGSTSSSDPVGTYPGGTGFYFGPLITGLKCGTTYHFAAHATNAAGLSGTSPDLAFKTLPCTVVTLPVANSISALYHSSDVIMNGSVGSMGGATTVTGGFDLGLTTSYGTHITYGTPLTSTVSFASPLITGLKCGGTTYHYRAWVTNSAGTHNGLDRTFVTFPCPATITTIAPASVSSTSTTVTGQLLSMGGWSPATVGFDYATYPLSSTTYGTRVVVGAKTAPATFSLPLTGLAPKTVYHYRAWARNGTSTEYVYGTEFLFTSY